MINVMSYKGYKARIDYDDADEILVGHIAGISDIVGFHADTVADLKKAFEDSVDDYLDTCRKAGKEPQKAFSGNLMLRISPELHADVALAAQLSGVSINQLAEAALKAIGDASRQHREDTAGTSPKISRRKAKAAA